MSHTEFIYHFATHVFEANFWRLLSFKDSLEKKAVVVTKNVQMQEKSPI